MIKLHLVVLGLALPVGTAHAAAPASIEDVLRRATCTGAKILADGEHLAISIDPATRRTRNQTGVSSR